MKAILCFNERRRLTRRLLGWLLVAVGFHPGTLHAQTIPQWAWGQVLHTNALNAVDRVTDMVSDRAGNVYAVGLFSDSARFGPHLLYGSGSWDVFVAKFSPTGQCLWATSGGSTGDDYGSTLALDAHGNVYVPISTVDDFRTTCGVTPNPIPRRFAGVLWKINANGNCRWAKVLAYSPSPATAGAQAGLYDVTITSAGDPILALDSDDSVRIGGMPYAVQGSHQWLVRCDSTGTVQGLEDFNNSLLVRILAVASSPAGTLVWGGGTNVQLGSLFLPGSGNFVALLDTAGTWQWAKRVIVQRSVETRIFKSDGRHLLLGGRLARSGSVSYDGQVVFPPGPNVSGSDSWLLRLDAATGARVAGYRTGVPTGALGDCDLQAAAVEPLGSVYLAGTISGTVELLPGQPRTAVGTSDGFVVKLDSVGQPQWELVPGVPASGFRMPSGIYPQAMALAGPAGPVIGGVFYDSVTLGPTTLYCSPRQGFDLFLAGIDQPLGLPTPASGPAGLQVWPNPTRRAATVRWPAQSTAGTLTVRNALGQVMRLVAVVPYAGQAGVECADLPIGLYEIELAAGSYHGRSRLVVAGME